MRKLANVLGFIADFTIPALTVLTGIAVMIGGATGTLWI